MIRRLVIAALFAALGACAVQQSASVAPPMNPAIKAQVWLFDGLGGNATSPGVPQIARKLAANPAVQIRGVYLYDSEEEAAATELKSQPSRLIKIIFGYSCGVWSTSKVANAVYPISVYLVAIQGSDYCEPQALRTNVIAAQETYNADWIETFGLGAAAYTGAPGFPASRITLINRPDSHGSADLDPDAQNDVARFVQAALGAVPKAALYESNKRHVIVRHHGE